MGYEEGYLEGIERGKAEGKKMIIFQIFLKFPDWTDIQVAELVDEPFDFIKKTRKRWRMKQA